MALEHVNYVLTLGSHKGLQLDVDVPAAPGADGVARRSVSVDKVHLVLTYLALRADPDGRVWVGYRRISDDLGIAPATVLAARKQLVQLGIVVPLGKVGRQRDVWQLELPNLHGVTRNSKLVYPRQHARARDAAPSAPVAQVPAVVDAAPLHADHNGDPMPDNVREKVRSMRRRRLPPAPDVGDVVHTLAATFTSQPSNLNGARP